LAKKCLPERRFGGITFCFYNQADRLSDTITQPLQTAVTTAIATAHGWGEASGLPDQFGSIKFSVNPLAEYTAYYLPTNGDVHIAFDLTQIDGFTAAETTAVAIHELFHALDDSYAEDANNTDILFLSYREADYREMHQRQFAAAHGTGWKLWDLAVYNCAYSTRCIGGYDAEQASLLRNEALAEEKAVLCTYKQRVINRVTNVGGELATLWRQTYHEELPADYPTQRDTMLARWQGKNASGATTIQPIADWYANCLK
jgi:hypothetical protein